MTTAPTGETFRVETDRVEVTCLRRPDTAWRFVDRLGHEHRWFESSPRGVAPATAYRPDMQYETPTLRWVKDGEAYWPGDDEPHDIGHFECVTCGEHIEPRYTADTDRQYVPGLRRCYINDQPVSLEEFERRAREAGLLK